MDKSSKAVLAQQILDNPVYQEAIDAVQQKILLDMKQSSMFLTRKHTKLVMKLQVAEEFEREFKKMINRAKLKK